MKDPSEMRKEFLSNTKDFMEKYLDSATGKAPFACPDKAIRDNVWNLIAKLILQSDDPIKLKGLGEGTITEQVDLVMKSVADGNLTIQQGKRLIEMLQAGFDITELPKLIEKLNEIETA